MLLFCLWSPFSHTEPTSQAQPWKDSYSQPSGKWMSGTALLDKYSSLALRTPFSEPTSSSFCVQITSRSTNSTYVQMRKATSASCLHLGYISISSSVLLSAGAGPWSLSSSITLSLTQIQTVLTLNHRQNMWSIVCSKLESLQA